MKILTKVEGELISSVKLTFTYSENTDPTPTITKEEKIIKVGDILTFKYKEMSNDTTSREINFNNPSPSPFVEKTITGKIKSIRSGVTGDNITITVDGSTAMESNIVNFVAAYILEITTPV